MRRSAFTLVELMIIIGILAILAAIVLPQLTNASSKAQAATIATNMRALTDACRVAHEQNGERVVYNSTTDGAGLPGSLQGLFSEQAWSDIAASWGGGQMLITHDNTGLYFALIGGSDLAETLEELERLVDDGDSTTGALTWHNNGQYVVGWILD